jgi:predicted dienelactone hydrolase
MMAKLAACFSIWIAARAGLLSAVLLLVFAGVGLAQEPSRTAHAGFDLESRPGGSGRPLVGHSTRILNVPGTLGEPRPVNVHLWYPAHSRDDCDDSGNSDENAENQGCSATPSVYTSRLNGIPLLPQWDPLSWTIGSSESFENVPIARGHRPFPVIIFSGGSQTNAINYVYTLEALASFGFIVAAPDHLNDTQDDIRIDFVNKQAGFTLIPCFDGLAPPCSRGGNVRKSMTDRAHDISAVLDALPTWFGERVDMTRVGVMSHSRGTVTALAAAGGSTTWGFPAEPRVKAIMGLAIGVHDITFGANLEDVTVPALLVAGTLDATSVVSKEAFDTLASTEKNFVLIENAKHRHFISASCAQTQSSGAIAQADSRAILDLQTATGLLSPFPLPIGVAMDFCGFETFTNPTDIRPLVASLTRFNVTPTNVPTTGLDSSQVKNEVVQLAIAFFGHALEIDSDDNRPFTDLLLRFKEIRLFPLSPLGAAR